MQKKPGKKKSSNKESPYVDPFKNTSHKKEKPFRGKHAKKKPTYLD